MYLSMLLYLWCLCIRHFIIKDFPVLQLYSIFIHAELSQAWKLKFHEEFSQLPKAMQTHNFSALTDRTYCIFHKLLHTISILVIILEYLCGCCSVEVYLLATNRGIHALTVLYHHIPCVCLYGGDFHLCPPLSPHYQSFYASGCGPRFCLPIT